MSKGTQLSNRPTVLNSAYCPLGVWVCPLRCGNTLPSQHEAGVESCVPAGTCHGRDAVGTKQWGSVLIFVLGKIGSYFVFLNPFSIWLYTLVLWPPGPRGSAPPHCTMERHMQTGGPLCRRRSGLLMDN